MILSAKKIVAWLLGVSLLICSVWPVTAMAEEEGVGTTFENGGYHYEITGDHEVAFISNVPNNGNATYSGEVNIPENVVHNETTYTVTAVAEYAFFTCSGVTKVTVPNTVKTIGDKAFYRCKALKEVDLIAAEDTRNSIKLLNHFDIKTPMTSYHEYNKVEKAYTLIEKMQEGLNVALITDAGTPGISDPGEVLAAMCYDAGIEVTSLPGPAACITALTLSGLSTRRFAFEALSLIHI